MTDRVNYLVPHVILALLLLAACANPLAPAAQPPERRATASTAGPGLSAKEDTGTALQVGRPKVEPTLVSEDWPEIGACYANYVETDPSTEEVYYIIRAVEGEAPRKIAKVTLDTVPPVEDNVGFYACLADHSMATPEYLKVTTVLLDQGVFDAVQLDQEAIVYGPGYVPENTEEVTPLFFQTTGSINLRRSASLEGTILISLPKGSKVEKLGRTQAEVDGKVWYMVRDQKTGFDGWVAAENLEQIPCAGPLTSC